ncbi:MAG: tRNA epoxyqueuosine(34) reductase QueG [Phycisphaerae bacterium]
MTRPVVYTGCMEGDGELALTVKRFALEAGFARAGIASAGAVAGRETFNEWLSAGRHGKMDYLARNVEKRFDPRRLVEGARSVICVALSYAPGPDAPERAVARFARGRDYHRVLKQRLHRLMDRLREVEPGFAGRAFTDSAPLAERSLAVSAGLGWIGRNGCLIVPGLGSYVVLGEIVCNLPLSADRPLDGGCGECGRCIQACPTGALRGDGTMDARLCVGYLTVEHRGSIDPALCAKMGGRLFGCDACQRVCPHNADIPPGDPELIKERPIAKVSSADLLGWTEADWDTMTRGSTTRRADYPMWLRNAAVACANAADPTTLPALRRLAEVQGPAGEAARWALAKLSDAG